MRQQTSCDGEPISDSSATPVCAASFLFRTLLPQLPGMGLRNSRELITITKALDLWARGLPDAGADVFAHQLKALHMSLTDQNWTRAQYIELIPLDQAQLMDESEQELVNNDLKEHRKLAPPDAKGKGKDNPHMNRDGKGKGKSKDKDKDKGAKEKDKGYYT